VSDAQSTPSPSSAGKYGDQLSSGLAAQFSESFHDLFRDAIDDGERVILADSLDAKDAVGNVSARGFRLAVAGR
jgi:hypothetical protein